MQILDQTLTKKDFESGLEVKWCPGCGGYSILAAIQKGLAEMGLPREKHVFVSGIGCSSRLPYYMSCYGFHTIHGRAPAIATGVKLANPDLTVWIITGDGDALSIGGNHFIHLMRRNLNINVVLFNNRIYGLTKGQASPTSAQGTVTKSSPLGSFEHPVNPIALALGAGASFAARSLATDLKGLTALLKEAAAHRGASFIEVYQNCVVFNDNAFGDVSDRATQPDHTLTLRDGEPLRFGKNLEKGIALEGLTPKVVASEASGVLTFDKRNRLLAHLLTDLQAPEFPVPFGLFYQEERTVHEEAAWNNIRTSTEKRGRPKLADFLQKGDVWKVQ